MKNLHELRASLLAILTKHVGREKAIGMGELYEAVYGKPWRHRINDTRPLRHVITDLRREGRPICSVRTTSGPGYYLPGAASEQRAYVDGLKREAIRKLSMAAKIEEVGLHELLGQMSLNLRPKSEGGSHAGRTKAG